MITAPASDAPPWGLGLRRAALLLAALGCGDGQRADSGIAVGNPGFSADEAGRMRATAGFEPGLSLTRVEFSAKQAILSPCGSGRRVPLGGTDGWAEGAVQVPAGDWCSLELKSLRLRVEGEGPDNAFAFSAKPADFALGFDAPPLAELPSLLVLGGLDWLKPELVDNGGASMELDEDSPEVEALLEAMGPAVLMLDADGDGLVSAGDSLAGR